MPDHEIALSIRDLRVTFGNTLVLKGVNLQVSRGQIIGYIGPNGAGKSTTIKTILGLIRNYTGEIKILDHDISNRELDYKRIIGYVPETAELYDALTAQEYLGFIGKLYGMDPRDVENKAKTLMRLVNLEQVYDSRLSSYSKGMRQKVLLISSLLHNPDILFLDEPLSGLDANSVSVVKDILAQLAKKGKTIFYSSHIMEVVQKISDRIVLLNGGQVVADGTFAELSQKSGDRSLEEVFNDITGFYEHTDIAAEFVSTIEGVQS